MTARPPAATVRALAWALAVLAVAGPITAALGPGDATWKALLTPILFAVPGVLVHRSAAAAARLAHADRRRAVRRRRLR